MLTKTLLHFISVIYSSECVDFVQHERYKPGYSCGCKTTRDLFSIKITYLSIYLSIYLYIYIYIYIEREREREREINLSLNEPHMGLTVID